MVTPLRDMSPRITLIILVLTAIVLIAFNIPAINSFFSQDDFSGLFVDAQNPSEFAEFFKPESEGARPWYRPVSFQLRYWLMREAFGFNPVPFHLLSIILHIANILLCYRLIYLLTNRRDISTLAAVLYGLNGAHQMALFWFSAGNEILTAAFYMWGVIAFIGWRHRPGFMRGSGVCLLFILALLCKETAVTFPFIILLTELFLRRDVRDNAGKTRSGKPLIIALCVVLILYLAFWFLFQYQPGGGAGEGYGLTLNPVKLVTNLVAFVVQGFIGRGILYAAAQSAVGGYPSDIARETLLSGVGLAVVAVICIFIAAIVFWMFRIWSGFPGWIRRLILFGLGWYVICLLPVLPLVGHNYAYYMNIALIGLAPVLAAIAFGLRFVLKSGNSLRKIGWVLLALYICNFAANSLVSAHVRSIPRLSVIAKQAYDEILETRPSFEQGTLLFILDVDRKFDWATMNGMMYRAIYPGELRFCYVLAEDRKVTMKYLEDHDWTDERPKVFYSWNGNEYVTKDEEYFMENYLSGD